MKKLLIFLLAVFTWKTNGQNLMWAKSVNGIYSDFGRTVATDKLGNVIYGGDFTGGTVDFDPGAGIFNLGPNGAGYFSKLDAYGNFLWAKQLNGNGYAIVYSITTDT